MSTPIAALRRRYGNTTWDSDRGPDAQAELALLREENRRLKAQLDRPPDLAKLMSRVKHDPVDEAAGLLAEDLVIREGLLEITRELRRFLVDIEARLGSSGA